MIISCCDNNSDRWSASVVFHVFVVVAADTVLVVAVAVAVAVVVDVGGVVVGGGCWRLPWPLHAEREENSEYNKWIQLCALQKRHYLCPLVCTRPKIHHPRLLWSWWNNVTFHVPLSFIMTGGNHQQRRFIGSVDDSMYAAACHPAADGITFLCLFMKNKNVPIYIKVHLCTMFISVNACWHTAQTPAPLCRARAHSSQ